MKTFLKNRIVLLFAFAAAIGASFYACKKTSKMPDNPSAPVTVTESDAVQMANDAVSPTSGGMTVELKSIIAICKGVKLTCGVQKDSTISYVSAQGASPSFSAQLRWNYTLSCISNIPDNLALNFSGSTGYSGQSMSLSGNSTGSFTLSGLEPTVTNYTLNSTYTLDGSVTSKIGTQHTFATHTTIKGNNIMITKGTDQITSGSGTISITGTDSNGNNFDFEGAITFNGGNKATVTFASGTTVTIVW